MTITNKQSNVLLIAAVVLAVMLYPIWPYSHWGYTPSILIAVLAVFLYMFKRLAHD